jgi:O-antigen ligase
MSNTASLKRTERRSVFSVFSRSDVATAIATILLTVIMVSFRPFQPMGALSTGGDVVNQLGFGSLGILSIFALASYADRRVLPVLISLPWLLMLGFFVLSAFNTPDPAGSLRAVAFTLIGMLAMAAVLVVPRDADAFSMVIATSGFIVLVLCYFGLAAFPNEAIHTTAGTEPQHAGLWRGVFTHKNIAGPVMACLSFGGLYLFRRGWRISGFLLFVMAMFFMVHTGSKTTAALVPVSILVVALPGICGVRILTPIVFSLALIVTALATLGSVFIEPMKEFALANFSDPTFTGRTTIWEFAGDFIARRPWIGYGLENFWGSPLLLSMPQPFDRPWDVRNIVHGHNGYLDIAVAMGIPALLTAIVTFLIVPQRDFMSIPMRKENVYLGDFFMMILLFTALNAFLESFFFRRADPVWLFFVFSIFGLRLAARFPIKARQTG